MSLMTREEWLKELVTVDEWGRPPSLADVPLTLMPRAQVFALRDYSHHVIDGMWKIYLTYTQETSNEI
tara:strand:+ start:1423 stop:1626 length:204 start_codon:yes stop_codon:yes gene_type:complete